MPLAYRTGSAAPVAEGNGGFARNLQGPCRSLLDCGGGNDTVAMLFECCDAGARCCWRSCRLRKRARSVWVQNAKGVLSRLICATIAALW